MLDMLTFSFPVSGVTTNVLLPPLVAMVISFFTSMGGLSGAFLLLPFQMSILNFTTPAVSSTNFLFNVVAIPSGVYRYIREGRMAWPLTMAVVIGTLPGVFLGYYLRILYFPDPRTFKLFVGCVLLYIGGKIVFELAGKGSGNAQTAAIDRKFQAAGSLGLASDAVVKTRSVSLRRVEYDFWGETFSFSTVGVFLLAFVVGIIGGIYGIGGGAIIAPFCVVFFHLPVYTVAGAALMGTFLTSIVGVLFYWLIPVKAGVPTSPDWLLGILFGAGGFVGMYFGARFQKFMPQKIIKAILALLLLFVAVQYIVQFFL